VQHFEVTRCERSEMIHLFTKRTESGVLEGNW
jgi:hypothetical protein